MRQSSPQSCVKVQPHQKHNVLRCEPNCHAFLSEERSGAVAQRLLMSPQKEETHRFMVLNVIRIKF